MGGAEGEGRLQCARRCFFFLLWSNLTKEEWDSEALTLPRTQVVSHKYREGMGSKENKKKDDCHLLLRLLFPTAKVRGKLKGKNNSKKASGSKRTVETLSTGGNSTKGEREVNQPTRQRWKLGRRRQQ